MASMGKEASEGRDKWEGLQRGRRVFLLTAACSPLTPEGGRPRDHVKDQRSVGWGLDLIVGGGILIELALYVTRTITTARTVSSTRNPSAIRAGHWRDP